MGNLCYKGGWLKSYSWDIIDGPSLDAVVHAIQLWYRHHSIRGYLARQTRHRLAATTIQCLKRHISLDCWFAQQAKKCLCLCLLCRGASTYAMLVWGSHRPPPTPTNTPSTPEALQHPFRDCSQPLTPWLRSGQCKCRRCCRG